MMQRQANDKLVHFLLLFLLLAVFSWLAISGSGGSGSGLLGFACLLPCFAFRFCLLWFGRLR
jgi:hypothetical protein